LRSGRFDRLPAVDGCFDVGDFAFAGWCRQVAAYAAGVSIACRRSSHFSFTGLKEK
jgi:hypothetical protein